MASGSFLPRFSLRRPVTVVMMMIAMVLLGVIAYVHIPVQLFPSGYTAPNLYVRIVYPNSTPKEVEDQIVRPAEEMFATLEGLRRMRSWANGDHGSFWMKFNDNASMTTIYNQVRDRLERLMPTLPEDVERYFIWKWNPDDQPILSFGISADKIDADSYRILNQSIFLKIQRLPGVSRLDTQGLDQPEIRIDLDRERARSHRLSVWSITNALRQDNFSMPSGQINDGKRRFFLRSDNRLNSVEALRDYPMASGIRLGEVAKVTYGQDPDPKIFRINGREGVFLSVFKESEANTIDLCNRIQKLLDSAFRRPEMKGFAQHIFVNQGTMIEDALWQLQQSALWGALFAMIILWIFLRHTQMTLLVLTAIPLSLLLTLACMYMFGESLNMLSLMGLMLSVGMVVDNAIVVVENISRLRMEGRDPAQAAEEGASEVALAISLATSTTIVVFLPLILMSGSKMFRFYMGKLGFPVSVALLASLLVALVVIPLGAYKTLGEHPPKPWPLFDRVTLYYRDVLEWVMRHRFDAALWSVLLFLTIFYPMNRLKQTYQGQPGRTSFGLRFTFTQSYPFAAKDAYLRRVEKLLHDKKEEWGVSHVGTKLNRRGQHAEVIVFLRPGKRKLEINRRTLIESVGQSLPMAPGVTRRVGWRAVGSTEASISLHLYGADSKTLEDLALRLEEHLQRYPDFKQAEAEIDRDQLPEIQLQIDRSWAFRYQFAAQQVGGNVYYALSGRRLRNMQIGGRDVPVRIQVQEKDRDTFQKLQQLPLIQRATNNAVPLNQVISSRYAVGPRVIRHVDRKTYLKLKISVENDNMTQMYAQLDTIMSRFPLPSGYTWAKGMDFRDLQEADASRNFALLLSITFVFLLMGILFESFLLPFSVVLSIPLAFLGVYWLLYLTDTALDMMGGIGLVMLIGIVVNHAIVMIDRINQLRTEGVPRLQAILDASTQRLRPILMTALTTICGLIPMAMGQTAAIGISYAALGISVMGGLTASVILSLFVVPLFYTFFDDLRLHWMGLAARLVTKKAPHPEIVMSVQSSDSSAS